MSQDFCMDCGVLLSVRSSICPVCGFDNNYDPYQDMPLEADDSIDLMDEFVSETDMEE